MKTIGLLFILLAGAVTFVSCEKDDPEIPNEEELITTVKYTLTPQSGGSAVVFLFRDLDGDGGNSPVITTSPLKSGTIYSGALELLNEAETPVENITEEIKNEGADHQFFFTSNTNISVQYNDKDLNGKPVGLKTVLTTGNAGTGKLKIILRHKPDKNAGGVANGDITNVGGETDIEVEFNVVIQ
jgi:hypothetical protein